MSGTWWHQRKLDLFTTAERAIGMQTASRTMPKIPGETAAPNTGLLGKQKCSQKNTDVIFIFIFGMESSTGKKKKSWLVYPYLHPSHSVFLPMKVAWQQPFQFQLVPLLRHLSSNELAEINTAAGYCSICDRKQWKITPGKVQEKNGIICPHKKLLLVMGFLRLLYTPKLLEFYPSNMKEIIKARSSNYPFFFFFTIILFKT